MLKRDSALFVPHELITDKEYYRITGELLLKNPDYENALRFSKYGPKKDIPEFIEFYVEDDKGLWLPRNYDLGEDYDKYPVIDNRVNGRNADIKFLRNLRDYQDKYMKRVDLSVTDLIFQAGCGHGKTTLGIYFASLVKKKTLVIVPTHRLVKQWKERLQYFTGETPYDFSGSQSIDKIDAGIINKHNFFITTLDTLAIIFTKEHLAEAYYDFLVDIGLTILDECHRTGADTYHPILMKLPSKYRLALTATFRRGDGREDILKDHFGRMFKLANQFPPAKFYAFDTGVRIGKLVAKDKLDEKQQNHFRNTLETFAVSHEETPKYFNIKDSTKIKELVTEYEKFLPRSKPLIKMLKGNVVFAQLDNYVAEHNGRTKTLITMINHALEKGRTTLVLSKRKKMLKSLHNVYNKRDVTNTLVVSETNKISDAEYAKMEKESRIIFGIMQLAQEGLDIDRLDTLILVHPIIDTEQAVGRILRLVENKKPAVVVMLLDNCSSYFSMYQKSHTFISLNALLQQRLQSLKQFDEVI